MKSPEFTREELEWIALIRAHQDRNYAAPTIVTLAIATKCAAALKEPDALGDGGGDSYHALAVRIDRLCERVGGLEAGDSDKKRAQNLLWNDLANRIRAVEQAQQDDRVALVSRLSRVEVEVERLNGMMYGGSPVPRKEP